MPISHEGAAEKIGIEYSVIHSEKCSWAYSIPAIGHPKNMKLAARALISNREESDFF